MLKSRFFLFLLTSVVCCSVQAATLYRTVSGNNVLSIELLDDDIVHLEWAKSQHASVGRIYTSPMVSNTSFSPKQVPIGGSSLNTKHLTLRIDSNSLCVDVTDIRLSHQPYRLTRMCPESLTQGNLKLSYSQESFHHIYGLGQQHTAPGKKDGDWRGRKRTPGDKHGNKMVYQGGGAVGNTQVPIAYMLGQAKQNYALFLDNTYAQTWDFTKNPYRISAKGEALRVYLMSGRNLPHLRSNYLELTGRSPVPPRQAFGLWLSEYGYDNWNEVEQKVQELRAANFPLDGVVLDLPWYGGIKQDSDNTKMGSLRWDKKNFPSPETKIQEYKNRWGLGVLAIEQPYVGKRLPEYLTLSTKGYLVRQCPYPCDPVYLESNPWWGKGGMLDYSHKEGADFWHDWRRKPLVDAGLMGHWTDLGEPEQYQGDAYYHGVQVGNKNRHGHADVHNLYNLLWNKSIHEGYQRNGRDQRPFILSRSGTAGSQRYGVSLWSGDIGANLSNLASHLNAQMHMSLSGFDYFGSDIGGFHRKALKGDNLNEMYTQWMAVSAALDIPMRPHTENLCNCKETSPAKVGHVKSNLANIRQRYALTPYYYSLAHEAYLTGTAITPPLVYYYQDDPGARALGGQKMIGPNMMVATVAEAGARDTLVYLPKGEWVNYHTHERYDSQGEWVGPFDLYNKGIYRLPTFVRAGTMIPHYKIDDSVLNIDGLRKNGTKKQELEVVVYPGKGKYKFTLFEDDGHSIDYQKNRVVKTDLILKNRSNSAELTIAEGKGLFDGMTPGRDINVLFVTEGQAIKEVSYRHEPLKRFNNEAEYKAAERGWWQSGNKVYAKYGEVKKAFVNHIEIKW